MVRGAELAAEPVHLSCLEEGLVRLPQRVCESWPSRSLYAVYAEVRVRVLTVVWGLGVGQSAVSLWGSRVVSLCFECEICACVWAAHTGAHAGPRPVFWSTALHSEK